MLILQSTFLGADYSFCPTPTNIDNISQIDISDGTFDTLKITKNAAQDTNFIIDTTWDKYTVMCATYDTNLSAGNVNYVLDNTTDLIIKRRKKGTLKWTSIYHKKVSSIEDFDISFIDLLTASKTRYEYACVGMLNNIEGTYNIVEVDSDFDGLFLIGKYEVFGTFLDVGYCDTERNHFVIKQELLNQKYPIIISNSKTNYDSGNAEGYFVKYDPNTCEIIDENSIKYRNDFTSFLTDNEVKILKHYDGRMWMIVVDGNPTNSAGDHYLHRITSFNWIECGDCDNENDLHNAGLIDVTSDFWSE